jgi:hypothetical protein
MTVNLDKMMLEVCEALEQQHEYHVKAQAVLEEWIPQVANEITDLRNKVMLLETEAIGLRQEIMELS